ncbi:MULTISPECIES: hypothetical protein [Actinoplanes]|uniref:hypothetical protein n=1 Tax=Actinoplanes TaxID=1865 RepID=UPI0012F913FA|nr:MULTISPECIES: hypothetical protein [Actinoplanes]GLY00247.1 hypothetical protein Acsp01_06260 [Actinoplanes sp. NBRC 101535]
MGIFKRAAAVAVAGAVGATLIASPALAVGPDYEADSSGSTLYLYNDARTVLVGYVVIIKSGSSYVGVVCDTHNDGYFITGRFDPGSGNVQTLNSPGYQQCADTTFATLRKYRLSWNGYTTPNWYAPTA